MSGLIYKVADLVANHNRSVDAVNARHADIKRLTIEHNILRDIILEGLRRD